MKLDIVALVSVISAGIAVLLSLITFFAYFRVEKRKRKAEARKTELDGDNASLDYLTRIKDQIRHELEDRIKALEERIKVLEEDKREKTRIIAVLKYILSKTKDCPFNQEHQACPCEKEYNTLIGNE